MTRSQPSGGLGKDAEATHRRARGNHAEEMAAAHAPRVALGIFMAISALSLRAHGVDLRAMSLWQGSSSFLADLVSPAVKRRGALQAAARLSSSLQHPPGLATPSTHLN